MLGGRGPATNCFKILCVFIAVPPNPPVIEHQNAILTEGANTTLTCSSNLGKPAGVLEWLISKPGESGVQLVTDERVHLQYYPQVNTHSVIRFFYNSNTI